MNKQSQHINHKRIAALLTHSTGQLDSRIVASLSQVRTVALQKQRRHEPAFSLSAIGHRAHNLMPHSTQQWVAATILLAALLVGVADYWQNTQVPLDVDILTDDLPIEVFLDH